MAKDKQCEFPAPGIEVEVAQKISGFYRWAMLKLGCLMCWPPPEVVDGCLAGPIWRWRLGYWESRFPHEAELLKAFELALAEGPSVEVMNDIQDMDGDMSSHIIVATEPFSFVKNGEDVRLDPNLVELAPMFSVYGNKVTNPFIYKICGTLQRLVGKLADVSMLPARQFIISVRVKQVDHPYFQVVATIEWPEQETGVIGEGEG